MVAMLSSTLSVSSLPHPWAHSCPVSLILLVSYPWLAKQLFASALTLTSLLFSVLAYAERTTRKSALSSCGKLRAMIVHLRCRTLETRLYRKRIWAHSYLKKTHGQSPEYTKRAQSPWPNESSGRNQDRRAISSTAPTSSSHALSTTMPWTIKHSLAVLWVCLCTIIPAPCNPLIYFQGVCWMYYPAEDNPAYVNNSSADQQYSFDWNQIEQSYQDIDLETSTWPRVPSLPRTLPANTEYSARLGGSFPASTAGQALPISYDAAGSQPQEQDLGETNTFSGGAAFSRDRYSRKRGESDSVLARIAPRTPLGRDDQGESFQPKMLLEVPRAQTNG